MVGQIGVILSALEHAGARYLVAGGVAVVLHGHLRTTADLDLVVHLDQDNLIRALTALEDEGFRPLLPVNARDFANPEIRRSWVQDKGMLVFSLWTDRGSRFVVDLFAAEPIPFEDAWNRRVDVDIEGLTIHVLSIDDLVELKLAVGRPLDLDDVRALRVIQGVKQR